MLSGASFKDDIAREEKQAHIAMDKDDEGYNMLTPEYLKELCKQTGQFENPKLNDCLFLHYKGFRKIQGLDKFVNLRALWLECNGIISISGLENLVVLRSIYLHQNQITVIENLNHLKNLCTLNLSSNKIKVVEGLAGCDKLRNLDLAGNLIQSTEACHQLLELPVLASLDMKNNLMDDHDNFIEFFGKIQTLNALYLRGNPGTRNVSQYRKNMVHVLSNLNYLEDRPVADYERLFAEAWKKGGKEAEDQARIEYKENKQRRITDFQSFGQKQDAIGIKGRKMVLKRMMDELRGKKDAQIDKRNELKQKYNGMSDFDQMKPATLLKVRQLDQELKADFYKILDDKGEERPNIATTAKDIPPVINKQFQEKTFANEARMKVTQSNYKDKQEEFRQEMVKEREEQIAKNSQDENGNEFGSEEEFETEQEFQTKLQGDRVKAQFKWNPENEAELEEILINHQFDFKAATQAFSKFINEDDKQNFYEVDEKTVQLRWTDIEIRKHRLQNMKPANPQLIDDEDVPELEEDSSRIAQLQGKSTSPSAKAASPPQQIVEVEDIKDYQDTTQASDQSTSRGDTSIFTTEDLDCLDKETKEPVQSNIIDYADGSSSEDEVKGSKNKVPVTHYNDLEELD